MEFTVRQVLEAVRKNGYKQAFGYLVRGPKGRFLRTNATAEEIGAACAIGQAALNLGVKPGALQNALTRFIYRPNKNDVFDTSLGRQIIRMNDADKIPVPEIGNTLLESLTEDVLNSKILI
jgi:hypothetical protein